MQLIDTHCHIYYDEYKNLKNVIKNALDNNVYKMICVAVDYKTSLECLKISQKYQPIYATAGFHPHESKDTYKSYLKDLESLFINHKVVAIGETGLDYYYNHSDKKTQIKVFKEQLELAKSLDKPAIIHCREAEDDIIKCLKEIKIKKGIIHCFSGDINFANKIFDLGLNISFTGLITFNNELIEVIKNISLNKIMLETDSPYLTPVPYRGKRNEPWMVSLIAKKIAEVKNIPLKEVAKITTNNAINLFGF